MTRRYESDWEALARREPYFAVLTNARYLRERDDPEARAAFFASGEAAIADLLSRIDAALKRRITLGTALDFGCGVGRLTLPLARRAGHVTGCDVSPTMLEIAHRNAEEAGLQNVRFIPTAELEGSPGRRFDFICSLLVFQHIPTGVGYPLFARLLASLAAGGVAAIHLPFHRKGGRLRSIARGLRARFAIVHRLASIARREPLRLPYMQMNPYDEEVIRCEIARAKCVCVERLPIEDGDIAGAVLIIERVGQEAE